MIHETTDPQCEGIIGLFPKKLNIHYKQQEIEIWDKIFSINR